MGQHVELTESGIDIGRSDQCALCIESDKVSRQHARIVQVAGQFVVMDLDSTNGTFVNDQRIDTAPLRDGDQIGVGSSVLKYTESYVELQYFEHVLSLATQDALTGTLNKRKFDELIAAEARRANESSPLSLILFDIDHFKRFNDEFGHAVGDEVLKMVANLARSAVGDAGQLCRVGGEEFAVLLSGCGPARATIIAERLRHTVADHRFDVEGDSVEVTISAGVASWQTGWSPQTLYEQADALLYRSKNNGRNQVSHP